jgi:hypothetical protein
VRNCSIATKQDACLLRNLRICSIRKHMTCHLCLKQSNFTSNKQHMHVCRQGYSRAAGACIEAAKRVSRRCWQYGRAGTSCNQATERWRASHCTIGRAPSIRHGTLCSCWAHFSHSTPPNSARTAQLDAWRPQEYSKLDWPSARPCSLSVIDTCGGAPVSICPDWRHTATAAIQSMDTYRAKSDTTDGASVPPY